MSFTVEEFLLCSFLFILFFGSSLPKNIHIFRETEYISLNQTNCIKGFLACGVMLFHLTRDASFARLFFPCGSLFVGLFFFYTGYGIMYQYLTRGEAYLKGFPKKKLGKVLMPWVILALFSPVYYAMGADPTAALETGRLVQNILEQIGEWVPNGWFIFVTLLFQLVFYCLVHFGCRKPLALIIGNSAFVILYMMAMYHFGMGHWWYYRCHCFILGLIWASYREELVAVFKKHYFLWLLILTASLVRLYIVYVTKNNDYLVTMAMLTVFVVLVQLVSMKLKLGNPVLTWLGSISMEMYLVHGYMLEIVRMALGGYSRTWLYGLLVVLSTLVVSTILKRCLIGRKEMTVKTA